MKTATNSRKRISPTILLPLLVPTLLAGLFLWQILSLLDVLESQGGGARDVARVGAAAGSPDATAFPGTDRNLQDDRVHAAREQARLVVAVGSASALALGLILLFLSTRQLVGLSRAYGVALEQLRSQTEREERERLNSMADELRRYAIFMLNAQGRVASWNTESERLMGYRPDDIIGRHASCLYCDDDIRGDRCTYDLNTATNEGRAEVETYLVRKDGFRFKARIAIIAIRDPDTSLCGFTKVIHEIVEEDSPSERARGGAVANL